jgi:hypothetical protein
MSILPPELLVIATPAVSLGLEKRAAEKANQLQRSKLKGM